MIEILLYLGTFLISTGLFVAINYVFRRIDHKNIFRKKNCIIAGLIIFALAIIIIITTPVFRKDLTLGVSISLITISAFVGLFGASFYKIHRRPHFSIKKYFTKLPEEIETITAVIPNYNYANYLRERVASIINQKYPISELIILDDCSSDNSIKVINQIVKELEQNHPNVKVRTIINSENSGNVFKQWAKAFKYATGDYVWICEADDLCSPYFLKQVMPAFKKDQKVVLSYAESDMIDANGKRLMSDFRGWVDYRKTGHYRKSFIIDGKKDLADYQAINNTIANVSGVVFKNIKDIPFEKYLKTSEEFRLAGDWYFYSKVLLYGKLAYQAESLNSYRSHPGSVSKVTDNFTHYKEIVTVQDSISHDLTIPSEVKAAIEKRRGELKEQWGISDDFIKYVKMPLDIKSSTPLSVIVPVHNTEKYLSACLDSILLGLPERAEIIIVDDASTDGSLEIIRNYQKKYPEITIRGLKKCSGVSAARNLGISLAKGKYITFVDSDDFVSKYMHSILLKKALEDDADIVHCDIALFENPQNIKFAKMESTRYQDEKARILDCGLMASPCNKIYKRELFKNVSFPSNDMNEDVAVVPKLILSANKIRYIGSAFYYYVQRSDSVQHEKFSDKRLAIFEAIKEVLSSAEDENVYQMVAGLLASHQILQTLIWIAVDEKDKKNRYKYIEKFCIELKSLKIDHDNIYIKRFLSENNMPELYNMAVTGKYYSLEKYIHRRRLINAMSNH